MRHTTIKKIVAAAQIIIVAVVVLSAIAIVFTLAGIGTYFALHHMQW